jgi:hypothetical protein
MKRTGSTTSLCGIVALNPEVAAMSSAKKRKPGNRNLFIV